ncbi:MAG: DMT family transporter [Sphingomonadaceae bacterium]
MPPPASQEKLSPPRFGLTALLIANILGALGALLIRLADTGPVASAFWRMAIAFPLIMIVVAFYRVPRGGFTPMLAIIVAASGLLFAADLASWHVGVTMTKLANATLFGNSASLIFPLYAFLAARMWPSHRQASALLLAAIGAGLLMGRSAELSREHLVGDLLSLLAGVFYAAYLAVIAHARGSLAPLPLLAATTLAAALPLLPAAWLLGEQIMPGDWWPLIGLAVGSQALAQGLTIYVLGRMSPLIIGLSLLTQPVVAALAGWVIFGETLGLLDLVGAALVGLALVLVLQPAKVPAGDRVQN